MPPTSLGETTSVEGITAPGRGDLTSSRLEEHLQATVKRLKKLGVRPGACIASALPDGPDATTAALAAKLAQARFVKLAPQSSFENCQALLLRMNPKLLLLHSGAHPAREAAHSLGIPVANLLRHFEAGIFTLEIDIQNPAQPPPAWKHRARGVPVVLIAPGPAYRRLANRLDATNPVVGITPPSLEHLPLPHTIEHIAAECVRLLRRFRPQGPYALAGLRADALVALEMARLLEEDGEKVVFVAMLDASRLFDSWFKKLFSKPRDQMGQALRRYRPHPWFGKLLHLRPRGQSDWPHHLAPHGFASYDAPAEMLAEPHVQIVATILAAELLS